MYLLVWSGQPACVPLTVTLQLLLEDAVHELAAHVTEGGAEEGVVLEAVRDVDLESLLEVLHRLGKDHQRHKHNTVAGNLKLATHCKFPPFSSN